MPVAGLVGFSPLPGGIGGVEVVLSGLLVTLAGHDPAVAPAATLLYRLSTLGTFLVAGALAAGVLTALPGPSRPI
ncbi:hypothetical protein BRD00_04660 [Halobacteriales archaeon QS_8_69_26]|nr:MAG: hypothetical protein BRD00_04660 [Halobacteriales archaeon QS_8_69_26]